MAEHLLSPSQVRLFGREFGDLQLNPGGLAVPAAPLGANSHLRKQLLAAGARLARIYAISYEGTFYNLPKPAIFLVHGAGAPIQGAGTAAPGPISQPVTDDSGMAARDFTFESDVVYWEYDKEDISLRLDVVAGRLEEILIDAALSPTSRYAITSRIDMTSRIDLASRSDATRTDLASRIDLVARHRLSG
jgi:hypothetical protein